MLSGGFALVASVAIVWGGAWGFVRVARPYAERRVKAPSRGLLWGLGLLFGCGLLALAAFPIYVAVLYLFWNG